MPEEIFDVVDEHDRVIGSAPRSEVHARRLLHRAVHVFLFNTRGELLVQTRSATVDEFPLCYNSSVSGHVSTGESYEECAPREMQEEIGLSAPLEFLAKFPASPETAREHTVLYRAYSDEQPIFDTLEVAAVAFYELDLLKQMRAGEPERFSPPFRVLLDWYLAEQSAIGRR